MSINIKTVAHKNPQDLTATPKYYARAVQKESVTLDDLVSQISNRCTVTRPDAYAVVLALLDDIKTQLSNGNKVTLGKLGSFKIGVSSTGEDDMSDVNSSNVERAKINFAPGRELKQMLQLLEYKKVS